MEKVEQRVETRLVMTAEELIARLDSSGPIICLYNAVSLYVNPHAAKDDQGYVLTSTKPLAQKIGP